MELFEPPTSPCLDTYPPARVLIVEDDMTMEPLWRFVLEKVSPRAILHWVTTGEGADRLIRMRLKSNMEFDIVVADVFLGGAQTGIDLWRRYAETPMLFLLMSVVSQEKFAELVGRQTQKPFYLQKPLDPDACVELLRTLLDYKRSIEQP